MASHGTGIGTLAPLLLARWARAMARVTPTAQPGLMHHLSDGTMLGNHLETHSQHG